MTKTLSSLCWTYFRRINSICDQSNCQRTPDPVRGPGSSLYLWPQTDSPVILIHNPFLPTFVGSVRSSIRLDELTQQSSYDGAWQRPLSCWCLGHSHACKVLVKIKPPWWHNFSSDVHRHHHLAMLHLWYLWLIALNSLKTRSRKLTVQSGSVLQAQPSWNVFLCHA